MVPPLLVGTAMRSIAIGLATLFVTGCATAGDSTVVADRVTVIDRDPGTEITVQPDRLLLPRSGNEALLASTPGDVLVGSRGTGFLRKVVTVADLDGQIEIATTPAALTDALVEADYDEQVHDAKWDWDGPKFDGVFFATDGLKIEGTGGAELTMTKGSVAFHPSLDLAMKMRWAKVTQFDLVASGALDAELGLHLQTDGAAQISYEKDLWESPSWTFVQMAGPVPIIEVVSVGVSLEVTGSTEGATSIDVSASAHSAIRAGARYRDGAWQRVGDHTLALRSEGPAVTSTNNAAIEVSMPIELHVQFYDLAGPFITLEPNLHAQYTPGDGIRAFWGLESRAGGQVNLLGAGNDTKLLGIEGTLFELSCELGAPVADCLR